MCPARSTLQSSAVGSKRKICTKRLQWVSAGHGVRPFEMPIPGSRPHPDETDSAWSSYLAPLERPRAPMLVDALAVSREQQGSSRFLSCPADEHPYFTPPLAVSPPLTARRRVRATTPSAEQVSTTPPALLSSLPPATGSPVLPPQIATGWNHIP